MPRDSYDDAMALRKRFMEDKSYGGGELMDALDMVYKKGSIQHAQWTTHFEALNSCLGEFPDDPWCEVRF